MLSYQNQQTLTRVTANNKRKPEQIKNVSRKMINQNISFKVKVSRSPKNKHNKANKL